MKNINRKGFTLIELLAVITIMGILMLVAIPAVSRTIENSRRDTFADNVRKYIETVRDSVLADELKCTGYTTVSGTPDGTYYYTIDTTKQKTQDLMEKVARSPWGNAELKGYVKWVKEDDKTTYYAYITDGANHGMSDEKEEQEITRSEIESAVSKDSVAPEKPKSDATAVLCELK